MEENEAKDIAEHVMTNLHITGKLEEILEKQQIEYRKRQDNTEKRYYHIATLVRAVAYGIMAADCYFKNYTLLPNFESVINFASFELNKYFKDEEVPELSINDFLDLVSPILYEHPEFLKWNESENNAPFSFVTSHSKTPLKRDFIDLEAVFQNISCYLRDKNIRDDFFDGKLIRSHYTDRPQFSDYKY